MLALIAFSMRILDAPTANRFWYVVGLRTDVTRGFVPFWITLGTFLTAYGIQSSRFLRWRVPWFAYTFLVVVAYLSAVWVMYETVPGERRAELPFVVHYTFLLAIVAPIVFFCLRVFSIVCAAGEGRSYLGGVRATGARRRRATGMRRSTTSSCRTSS